VERVGEMSGKRAAVLAASANCLACSALLGRGLRVTKGSKKQHTFSLSERDRTTLTRGNRQCTRGLPVQAQPELDVFRHPPAHPGETFEIAPRALSQRNGTS